MKIYTKTTSNIEAVLTDSFLELYDKFNKSEKSYDNISLLTCNFNNSYVTMKMLESFMRLERKLKIHILDNSTTNRIDPWFSDYFNVVDNYNFKLVKNYEQKSRNHCASIDYALKNLIDTDYVLLVDNDILYKKSFLGILSYYNKYDIIGEINYDYIIPDRLLPYCCIINLKKVKEEKINYFDKNRCCYKTVMYNTKPDIQGFKYITGCNFLYDTGASFYEDIRRQPNWKIKKLNLNDYIVHYMAGSDEKERQINNKYNGINYLYKNYNHFIEINKDLLYDSQKTSISK